MQLKKISQFFNYWIIMRLLMMVVILVGCAVSQSNRQENEAIITDVSLATTTITTAISTTGTLVPSVVQTHTATIMPTASATPTIVVTVTISPTITLTATSTPSLTLTPLPTIPPQQRGQVYTDLMSSNGSCALPCWWGFELGSTSLDEVRQFYSAFGAYISKQIVTNKISVLHVTFVDPQINDGEQVVHDFVAQNGIIIQAVINAHDPSYQIEPILQRLGSPSEVWMWTIPEPYEGILPALFYLYFPEQGVFVIYGTRRGVSDDDTVNICFDEPGGATLHLWDPAIWDPDGTKGFIDRLNESREASAYKDFHPIEEVSNWDAEEFYTILTDPTRSECLETPSNLWPSP